VVLQLGLAFYRCLLERVDQKGSRMGSLTADITLKVEQGAIMSLKAVLN